MEFSKVLERLFRNLKGRERDNKTKRTKGRRTEWDGGGRPGEREIDWKCTESTKLTGKVDGVQLGSKLNIY